MGIVLDCHWEEGTRPEGKALDWIMHPFKMATALWVCSLRGRSHLMVLDSSKSTFLSLARLYVKNQGHTFVIEKSRAAMSNRQ